MEVRRASSIPLTFYLFLAYFILCPKVGYANLMGVVLFALLAISALLQNWRQLSKANISVKYILFFFLIVYVAIVGGLSSGVASGFGQAAVLALRLSPLLLFGMVFQSGVVGARRIMAFSSLCIAYCICITWIYLLGDPYYARDMANYHSLETYSGYTFFLTGGGYSLLFGLLPLAALFGYFCAHSGLPTRLRALGLVGSIILLSFMATANLATTMILLVLSICIGLFVGGSKPGSLSIRTLILFLALLVLAVVFLMSDFPAQIGRMLLSLFPHDSIISLRIGSLLGVTGVEGGDTFSDRLARLQDSLEYIAANPIIGAGFTHGFDYQILSQYLGQHTEWVDFAGVFGIPILALYIAIYYFAARDILRHFDNIGCRRLLLSIFLIVIIAGLFDPIRSTSLYLVAFLIVPCACLLVSREDVSSDTQAGNASDRRY